MIAGILLAAALAASGPAAPKPVWKVEIGGVLPAKVLPLVGGGSIALPLDVPTVVNVFSVHCGPCRMEMPLLAKEIAARYDGRVRVVGVDRGEPEEVVAMFLRNLDIRYTVAIDRDRSFFRLLSGDGVGIPKTLLLDRSGRVVLRENGFLPGETIERLREAIDRLLAETPRTTADSSVASPPFVPSR